MRLETLQYLNHAIGTSNPRDSKVRTTDDDETAWHRLVRAKTFSVAAREKTNLSVGANATGRTAGLDFARNRLSPTL